MLPSGKLTRTTGLQTWLLLDDLLGVDIEAELAAESHVNNDEGNAGNSGDGGIPPSTLGTLLSLLLLLIPFHSACSISFVENGNNGPVRCTYCGIGYTLSNPKKVLMNNALSSGLEDADE